MGIQDDAIGRILANTESFAPLQREATQFALDTGRQSAADARQAVADSREDRSWMLTRRAMLSGVQDRLVSDANKFDGDQRADVLARQAGADASIAISNARASSARDLARRGVMPGTGRSDDTALVLGEAAMKAGGMNNARRAARQEGYALTDRATNALAGYPAMGMQATGQGVSAGATGASVAAGGVNIINAGVSGTNSGYGSAASIAGQMGAGATGMFNAQAGYKNAQDQIATSSDPFNTILGAAAGAATTKFMSSDPRLKTGVVPVGRDERTGLGLYEFAYIGATDGKRYRGVMADEVERKYPDAVSHDDLGFASVDYGRLGLEMVEV
jgi:hypothetical protein